MSAWSQAAALIGDGEVVGVPTDTVYGVAADPWSETAVARLFSIKGRPDNKPVGLLAASVDQVEEIADLRHVREAAARHWPGPLTLVLTPTVVIPDWIGSANLRTVGVRVPDHDELRHLLEETGPLAVTSANRSGEPEARDDEEARSALGDVVSLYVPGRCPGGVASTVADATGPELVVLRTGPVAL